MVKKNRFNITTRGDTMFRTGIFTILALLISFTSVNAQQFDEGIEYIKINKPVKTSNPDKVVVTELFWYGCPHCFRFEPYVEQWQKSIPDSVVVEQVPSVLNSSWMEHARAFFALQMMGETEKVHKKLFSAIHLKNKRLNSIDTLAAFVKNLGVDEKKFRDHYHSFPVDTLVRKSKQKERKYGHRGVPAVVINGKYRTSASQAGSNAKMIEVIDYLVKKEMAEMK
jgi:thiol:disulfide interchange protein DsbA